MLSFALVEARIVLRSDASELRMAVQPGGHLKNMHGSAEPRPEVNLAAVKGNQHLLFLPLDCAVSLSFGRLPSVFLSLSCSVSFPSGFLALSIRQRRFGSGLSTFPALYFSSWFTALHPWAAP
jgi:hypothetical protein